MKTASFVRSAALVCLSVFVFFACGASSGKDMTIVDDDDDVSPDDDDDDISPDDDDNDNDDNDDNDNDDSTPGVPKSCLDILQHGGSTGDGVYSIAPGEGAPFGTFNAYCDMTTAGGGWTLVLSYLHQGGSNPNLNIRSVDLPLKGVDELGADESGTSFWGHADNALVAALAPTALLFYGITADHPRVIHFTTSFAACVSYFATGNGSCQGVESNFQPLPDHTAYLPAAATEWWADFGDFAMTDFPFWKTYDYHWGIRGPTFAGDAIRWEVDDYTQDDAWDTLHRIFVR